MFKATEKVVSEIRKILESSEKYTEAKSKGQEVYVRLGTVDEGSDFAYTFMIDVERNSNDVVCDQYGLKFIFEECHSARMNKTAIDFIDEDNRTGISFTEEEVK